MAQPPVDELRKTKATTIRDPISECVEAVNAFHRKAILAEKQVHERIAAAVENAFQAGLALIELKKLVKHRGLGQYDREEVSRRSPSERQAATCDWRMNSGIAPTSYRSGR